MKILLSPAKSLDYSQASSVQDYSSPVFIDDANYLAKKLAKISSAELAKMMHLSDTLADLNVKRYQEWESPLLPTENVKQCAFVFTGEVYKGLDFGSLSPDSIAVAQEQIRILSGLYGVLRPLDLMYPYRLEMGTKWQITPKTKNLYAYWGVRVAKQIMNETNENEVLINLASAEYFKVLEKKITNRKIITPVFKELKGDSYKVVMMYAKHARGKMARYIVENKINSSEELKGYNLDGYRLQESLSSELEWVFTR